MPQASVPVYKWFSVRQHVNLPAGQRAWLKELSAFFAGLFFAFHTLVILRLPNSCEKKDGDLISRQKLFAVGEVSCSINTLLLFNFIVPRKCFIVVNVRALFCVCHTFFIWYYLWGVARNSFVFQSANRLTNLLFFAMWKLNTGTIKAIAVLTSCVVHRKRTCFNQVAASGGKWLTPLRPIFHCLVYTPVTSEHELD